MTDEQRKRARTISDPEEGYALAAEAARELIEAWKEFCLADNRLSSAKSDMGLATDLNNWDCSPHFPLVIDGYVIDSQIKETKDRIFWIDYTVSRFYTTTPPKKESDR